MAQLVREQAPCDGWTGRAASLQQEETKSQDAQGETAALDGNLGMAVSARRRYARSEKATAALQRRLTLKRAFPNV